MSQIHLSASAAVPMGARAAVLVAYGGPETRAPAVRLADLLHYHGLATLVTDVFTRDESSGGTPGSERIAHRVAMGLDWLEADHRTSGLPLGALADEHAAAGLLLACAEHPERVHAAACLGGQPDRAGPGLGQVRTPVLLLSGEFDQEALSAARSAQQRLLFSELVVVEQTHSLVDEPDAFHAAAYRIRDWFVEHLATEAH